MLKLGKYSDGPAVRRCSPCNNTGTVSVFDYEGIVEKLGEAEASQNVTNAGVTTDDDHVIDVHAICETSHKRSHYETNQRIGRADGHRAIAGRLNSKNGAGGPEHDRKQNVSPAALSLMRRYAIKVEIHSPMLVPLLRKHCLHM